MGRTKGALGPLTVAEHALCNEIDEIRGGAKRAALWTMYEIAGCLAKHEVVAQENLRKSLIRCGLRLDMARTTLSRYAFVHRRIRPTEFAELIRISDERGSPCTFWDLVQVAKLSIETRHDEIVRRLVTRSEERTANDEQPPIAINGSGAEGHGNQELPLPLESSARLRSAQPVQVGPGLARVEPGPQRLPTSENARSAIS
jgi:hypothetical protein